MIFEGLDVLGDLKIVPLRHKWNDEAKNFTPWLAKNIDKLGEAIGMDLEIDGTEAGVGPFSLDILAKDLGTSKNVVIENQLTKTDHTHLGQLITYAAGFEASIVVWIAESMREEHRQAIDWLNNITDGKTLFFGVVVRLITIDDSRPAVTFDLVAFPNEWKKNRYQQNFDSTSTRGESYRAYFQALIDTLRDKHRFTAARIGQPQNWYTFASGIKGIGYGANFASGGKARAEVYIDLGDADKNKFVLSELEKRSGEIQQLFNEPISWELLEDKRASRIALYRDATIEDSDAELEETRQWHIDRLLQFKKDLGPIVSQIVDQANQMQDQEVG